MSLLPRGTSIAAQSAAAILRSINMKKEEDDPMLLNVRTPAVMVRVALASAFAVVSVAGGFAQGLGQGQSQGQAQGQVQGQRQAQGPRQGQESSVQGRGIDVPFAFTPAEEAGQVVNGVFTIQRFVHEDQQVLAVGRVTATTTSTEGNVQNFVTQARLPVLPTTIPGDVCSTLHLEVGPLDVDLGGRRVQLDQIALDIAAQAVDITAMPGSENRLATQLCAVGGLLDGGGLSNAGARLATQLNQLLGILG